jgi:aryl-alcohol dehydrogenase-like predicted oxidoreductase
VRLALLSSIHAAGVTFWDSADAYMDSEEMIGKWFAATEKRSDIFLSTKFGGNRRNEPEYIKEACEKSLERLQTDHVDLYYCHRLGGKVPIELIVKAMAELKE